MERKPVNKNHQGMTSKPQFRSFLDKFMYKIQKYWCLLRLHIAGKVTTAQKTQNCLKIPVNFPKIMLISRKDNKM